MLTFAGGKVPALRKIIPFLFSFCFLSTSVVRGSNFYDRIKILYRNEKGSAIVDSITMIPYDVMVSDFDQASSWMNRAIGIANQIGYARGIANASAKLSSIKYLQGEYDSSVYYNLQAISLYDQLHDEIEMGAMYCELGYQMKRRNLSNAFDYFRKGLKLLEKNRAIGKLGAAFDNFGVLFEMNNQLDSADYFYRKALEMKLTQRDSIGMPYSLNNLGLLKMMEGNFQSAKDFFDQAYEIRQSRKDYFGIAESKAFYGDLYHSWQKWEESISWYKASNEDCSLLKYPRQMQYNFEQLAFCLEKIGRYPEAIVALQRSVQLKDELINEENSRTMLELEQKFKSSEKDKNIAVLEVKSARRTLWVYGISSALLLFIIGALWYNSILRRKSRAAKDAAIIAEREAGLIALFDATEAERKRIARDLHDGIGQQLSGLRMSWESLGTRLTLQTSDDQEKLSKLNKVLDEACHDLRVISHEMMPRALQEGGLMIALEELLQKTIGITHISYRFEHFAVEGIRFDERIELSLYRVCQELLGNILKHSKATEIMIQLFRNKDLLILIVEDNGIGMKAKVDRSSLGMMNIASRLSTVHGEAQWEPGPECGTVVTARVQLI